MWQDISRILVAHPLGCLLAIVLAVYMTIKSAKSISKDLERRNKAIGFNLTPRQKNALGEANGMAILVLFFAYLVGLYFLITWIASLIPFQFGL